MGEEDESMRVVRMFCSDSSRGISTSCMTLFTSLEKCRDTSVLMSEDLPTWAAEEGGQAGREGGRG
jgi:hypothetical protein